MNIVLLQFKVDSEEYASLVEEFPNYVFVPLSELKYKELRDEDWEKVSIIFGDHLTSEELEKARQLRWIHTPRPYLHLLCLEEIKRQGNISYELSCKKL